MLHDTEANRPFSECKSSRRQASQLFKQRSGEDSVAGRGRSRRVRGVEDARGEEGSALLLDWREGGATRSGLLLDQRRREGVATRMFQGRNDVEDVADVDFGRRMWVGKGRWGVEFGGKTTPVHT